MEILPVTSREVVRILGSLDVREIMRLLDELRILKRVNPSILRERRGVKPLLQSR